MLGNSAKGLGAIRGEGREGERELDTLRANVGDLVNRPGDLARGLALAVSDPLSPLLGRGWLLGAGRISR